MIKDLQTVNVGGAYDLTLVETDGVSDLALVGDSLAQRIEHALSFYKGNWFLDTRQGMDWQQLILSGSKSALDAAIRREVMKVKGVERIMSYRSSMNQTRLDVTLTIRSNGNNETIEVSL